AGAGAGSGDRPSPAQGEPEARCALPPPLSAPAHHYGGGGGVSGVSAGPRVIPTTRGSERRSGAFRRVRAEAACGHPERCSPGRLVVSCAQEAAGRSLAPRPRAAALRQASPEGATLLRGL